MHSQPWAVWNLPENLLNVEIQGESHGKNDPEESGGRNSIQDFLRVLVTGGCGVTWGQAIPETH